jgi:hypothetical protein
VAGTAAGEVEEGRAFLAAIAATFTMRPYPSARMCGMAARQQKCAIPRAMDAAPRAPN